MSSSSSIPASSTVILCNIPAASTTVTTAITASPTSPKLMDAKGSTEDSLIPTNATADVVSSKIPVDTTTSSQLSSNNPQEVDNKITYSQGAATPSLPQQNGILLLQKSLQNLELCGKDPVYNRDLSDEAPSNATSGCATDEDGNPRNSERQRSLISPPAAGDFDCPNGSIRFLPRNGNGLSQNNPATPATLQEPSPIIVVSSQSQPAEPFANQLQPVLANVIDEPDQRLLDALETPRDRLFVIKLEQDIVNFIRENNCEIFDLPPINAYHRLLTHKMAEYYRLTHVADATGSSVRLYRGQFARIPPVRLCERQVASSSRHSPSNSTVPAVKIMKRTRSERGTDTPPDQSNSTPKKPSSESSSGDGSSKVTTREEREAAYLEARARIFKDFVESSDVPQVKPNDKQKKSEKHDDFSTRSQFYPVAPPAPQVSMSFYPQYEDPRYHNQTGTHMPALVPSRFNTATPSFAPSANFMSQGYNTSIQNRQVHPQIERSYSPLGRPAMSSQQMFPQRNVAFPDSNQANGYKMTIPPAGNPFYHTHSNNGYPLPPQPLHNTPPAMSPAAVHRQPTTHIPYPVNGQTLAPRFPRNGPAWNAPNMGGVPMNARSSSGPAAPDRHTLPIGNIPYQPPYNQPQWGANGGLPKGGYNLGGMYHGPVGGM
ncbi:hypothetical protein RUND412_003145 [Rhizina undulata]